MKKLFSVLILSLLLSIPVYAQEIPDFALKVGMGKVRTKSGVSTYITGVSKYGVSPSGIQVTATDIWSRADATPTQQVWLAPTAAAYHHIKSSSASDDGAPVGVGARTIQIYGLTDWDTAESSEVITMNGTTDVTTDSMYVIIHRMKVVTSGGTSINVGNLTATAISPSATTITAIILAGQGQTNMAIYGVPSTQDFFLTRLSVAIDENVAGAATADFTLKVNPNPDAQTTNFIHKNHLSVQSTGSSSRERVYKYYPKFSGPCIIKVTAIASAADTDGKAGFDGYLVNKDY